MAFLSVVPLGAANALRLLKRDRTYALGTMAHRLLPLLLLRALTTVSTYHYPLGLSAAAQLLEVRYPLPKSAVRAAYRRKAATAHPDVSTAPNAESHFLRITAAYETLLQYAVPEMAAPSSVQTSATASSSPAPPQSQSQNAAASSASSSAAGSAYSSATAHDTSSFERSVSCWRDYWQATVQAMRLAHEAELELRHVAKLETEQRLLRAKLAALIEIGSADGATVDGMRARYAQASADYANARCYLDTLKARVRALQADATRFHSVAQGSPASELGI